MCDKLSKPSLARVLHKVSRAKVLKILFCLLLFATITKIMNTKKHNYSYRQSYVILPATLLARARAEESEENFLSNTNKYIGRKSSNTKKYTSRVKLCSANYEDGRKSVSNDQSLPIIYFVTPTYPRPEQYPLLIRLSHTLMHVPRIFWVVADDNTDCSEEVETILKRSHLPYVHIASPKIKKKTAIQTKVKAPQKKLNKSSYVPARGVANRRAALRWLQATVTEGILYFGVDDNTYDLELFKEIRKTKRLSMLPVGLIGHYGFSAPLVKKRKVIGFLDSWPADRKFPVDMAGFAVNIKHLRGTHLMRANPEAGMLEDIFLRSAGFELQDIEPLANNCTKILVWHTQVKKSQAISPLWNIHKSDLNDSELKKLSLYHDDIHEDIYDESMIRFVIWSTQAELYANFAQLHKT